MSSESRVDGRPSDRARRGDRSAPVYVGIDAGGTETSLVVGSSVEAIRHERGPGVNLQLDGEDTTAGRLERTIRSVVDVPEGPRSGPFEGSDREKEGRHTDRVIGGLCAGIAGAGRSDARARLRSELAARLAIPESRVRMIEDDRLALEAAVADGTGVVVMAGTGSIVRGRDRTGETQRGGGWGPVIGDEGGGRDLGRHAVQVAAHRMDGGPETVLVDRLREEWDVHGRDDLIRLVHERDLSLARLAPLLLDAAAKDDEVAVAVLEDRLGRLVRQVCWMVGRESWAGGSERLVLGGGLSESDVFRSTFRRLLADRLPGWTMTKLDRSPARAAWELARTLRDDR